MAHLNTASENHKKWEHDHKSWQEEVLRWKAESEKMMATLLSAEKKIEDEKDVVADIRYLGEQSVKSHDQSGKEHRHQADVHDVLKRQHRKIMESLKILIHSGEV